MNFPIRADSNAGSPVFIWTNAATITPGAMRPQDWATYKPSCAYYLPFNYARLTNNSLCDIVFYPNQDPDQAILIPAGSNVSIDSEIIPALYSFAIKNNDTTNTISINQLTLLCSKVNK